MEFTKESLREALKSTAASDLAQSFTDALNAAIDEINEEKKAQESAVNKAKDTALLLDHFRSYVETYYPKFPLHLLSADAETYEKVFDGIFGDAEFTHLLTTLAQYAIPKATAEAADTKISADPWGAFFKAYGL